MHVPGSYMAKGGIPCTACLGELQPLDSLSVWESRDVMTALRLATRTASVSW